MLRDIHWPDLSVQLAAVSGVKRFSLHSLLRRLFQLSTVVHNHSDPTFGNDDEVADSDDDDDNRDYSHEIKWFKSKTFSEAFLGKTTNTLQIVICKPTYTLVCIPSCTPMFPCA